MTEQLSHAEKQLALLFSRRLGPRLKQCIALVEQGFEQNWPADVFHRVHQHIDMILRGAERFGYDTIAEALRGLQASINRAAEQLTSPEGPSVTAYCLGFHRNSGRGSRFARVTLGTLNSLSRASNLYCHHRLIYRLAFRKLVVIWLSGACIWSSW